VKFYLGVTDNNWFDYLSLIKPEDANFWQPNSNTPFRILNPGEPLLFKLKSPRNVIGGLGFFSSHTTLPLSMAWEFFGTRNGAPDEISLYRSIKGHRTDRDNSNPVIGCIALTDPIFFEREDWIKVPWNKNIVQGKSYALNQQEGNEMWKLILPMIQKYMARRTEEVSKDAFLLNEPEGLQYGFSVQKIRLGQGPFRVLVTDAYTRKCAISDERTLPVLEAAHIKPYAESGPHALANGILLRSDIHKLFDAGYITITKDHKIEVGKRIKEEYENGKEYYQFHGKSLLTLPNKMSDRPSESFIDWQ
jgi:putative restriction endonuclease